MAAPTVDDHIEALASNAARHNFILSVLELSKTERGRGIMVFTVGGPGQCAVQAPRRNILLGELGKPECAALAEETREGDYSGVVGPDQTAGWFVEAAHGVGHRFGEPMPQCIYALEGEPRPVSVEGRFRQAAAADAPVVADWVLAFIGEAVPHDPKPERDRLEQEVVAQPYFLWECGRRPVSMAKIAREHRDFATISLVYTPPDLRGRGFASAVTAGVASAALERGKTMTCLYADLRNPASNRVYTNIGFEAVCDARFYPRVVD